jgi:hypothetical protein
MSDRATSVEFNRGNEEMHGQTSFTERLSFVTG